MNVLRSKVKTSRSRRVMPIAQGFGYPDFFEESPSCLMRLTGDGTILQINHAGQQLLELKSRPVGERFASYVDELDQPAFTVLCREALAVQSRRAGQVSLRTEKGNLKPVLVEVAPSPHRPECNVVVMELPHQANLMQSLVDTQERFDTTLHALPDMVFETRLDGRLLDHVAPKDGSTRRRLPEGEIADWIPAEAMVEFQAALREANEKGRARGKQIQLCFNDKFRSVELSIARKRRDYADGPHFVVLARDISQRKRAEELLRQNQELLRTLSKVIPLAMGSVTAKGECIHVSDGWRTITGRPVEAALGVGWIECVHPDDRERVSVLWRQAIQAGATFEAEYRLTLPGGGFKWVHCQCVPEKSSGGEILAFVGFIIDITERMNEREQLERLVRERTVQLLAMVMKLYSTEELERQTIAQELHDGLAQRLAIAKLKLSSLALDEHCQGLHCGLIREMETLVDEANGVVRSLSLQLSPPMLHEFGLLSALEWFAGEMYRNYGLHVIVSGDGVPSDINQTMLNQVFRATRELLINVAKHAQADTAEVSVVCDNDCLIVSVADSGVGFDPGVSVVPSTKGGYGLFSVRQHLGYIGGDVQIDSRPGDGSLVVLSVPLESLK